MFNTQTPNETRLLSFDFAAKVVAGATLSTPVVTPSLLNGVGLIGDLTLGTASVVDLTVICLGSSTQDGARYRLVATAHASNGEILEVTRDLPISASAALV